MKMEIHVSSIMKRKMFSHIVKLVERRGNRKKMVPMINVHNRYHMSPNASKHETFAILKELQRHHLIKMWRNGQHGITYVGLTVKGWDLVDRARERHNV